MPIIPSGDAKAFVKQYLSERNLDINPDALFEKIVNRCEIVSQDTYTKNINFKHRSFVEFFYAKHLAKPRSSFDFEKNAFIPYWMNIIFFYLGIRKDDPELIGKLSNISPESESERWFKLINMPNYMLAAYATPYNIISEATTVSFLEASSIYCDIANNKIESPFSAFSRMQFLHLMQYLMRGSYSFQFFKEAMEETALRIEDSDSPNDLKAYAMYFLNATYIEIGATDSFDMLLKKYANILPIDINLALHHEKEEIKERTKLMKKQDRKIKNLIKDNSPIKHEIHTLYENPMRLLKNRNNDD
jgi:hypothetical protein